MTNKKQKNKRKNKNSTPQQVSPDRLDELDKWFDEVARKYDSVMRRLANVDPEMLPRVRANMDRYHSALEKLSDAESNENHKS